jgi:hypothetical protein
MHLCNAGPGDVLTRGLEPQRASDLCHPPPLCPLSERRLLSVLVAVAGNGASARLLLPADLRRLLHARQANEMASVEALAFGRQRHRQRSRRAAARIHLSLSAVSSRWGPSDAVAQCIHESLRALSVR